ncbi:hypothetical protein FM076_32490 [Streptomyces albus subsp. chlorinus]|uniref:transposase n=1 Tax=Streptomyces albus TaxID=1888 RepID=UPI00157080FA|nr:hypothetical protein [Streptomyces albus subsp. chlorinus]
MDKEVPAQPDVHLVCDSRCTRTAPTVRTWLVQSPLHMHFTPAYPSWLNPVERWFGLPTDTWMRRGVHMNLQALERDIRAWIAQGNEDPKPFARAKDADQIPQRLASYFDQIPGAGRQDARRQEPSHPAPDPRKEPHECPDALTPSPAPTHLLGAHDGPCPVGASRSPGELGRDRVAVDE